MNWLGTTLENMHQRYMYIVQVCVKTIVLQKSTQTYFWVNLLYRVKFTWISTHPGVSTVSTTTTHIWGKKLASLKAITGQLSVDRCTVAKLCSEHCELHDGHGAIQSVVYHQDSTLKPLLDTIHITVCAILFALWVSSRCKHYMSTLL